MSGKVAIVFGEARGIATATTGRLGRDGFDIALT